MYKASILILTLLLLGFQACDRNSAEASCEILLQVSSMEFYEGCTIPISILAKDGNSQVDGISLTVNGIAHKEMADYPYVFYWNTVGYEAGEYEILASFVSSNQTLLSHKINITLLPVCVDCPEEVTDIDGNHYAVVQIGNQCWMAENMRTTHYADGKPLKDGNSGRADSLISSFSQPPDLVIGWYFAYEGDSLHSNEYGFLYNWPSVVNGLEVSRNSDGYIQGLAPNGWHIPEVDEWRALIDYLGGVEIAGARLKDPTSPRWGPGGSEGFGDSGFLALPGGCSIYNNSYLGEGESAYFWTATPTIVNHAYHILLSKYDSRANVLGHQDSKRFGYSLRCVMNSCQ